MGRVLSGLLVVVLVLVGCSSVGLSGPGGVSSVSFAPSSLSSVGGVEPVGLRMDSGEATALVRAGAVEPKPVVSAPITAEGELKGGRLWVYSVRVAGGATRLEWAVTHPSVTGLVRALHESERSAVVPELVVGGLVLRPSQLEGYPKSLDYWRTGLMGNQYKMSSKPHPMFTVYGLVPDGVESVQVRSVLIGGELSVRVDRGAEAVPVGSEAVPVRGRVVYGDSSDASAPDPLIVTVHGVRRLETTTVVYFSSVFPDGARPRDFGRWGGGSSALSRSIQLPEPFVSTFGLIDRSAMVAHPMVGDRTLKQGCSFIYYPGSVTDRARVCWALFPPLAEGTKRVDVVVGGQMLVQDVVVESGRLYPTSGEKFPLLGEGWPLIPADSIATATPEAIVRSTAAIRDVVVEGAITSSGGQLDLDAAVLFAYNESVLTPVAKGVIDAAVAKIKAFNRPGKLRVVGHTDSDGSDSANLDLSKRRAQAVADALKPLLGAGYACEVAGKGESEPVASNTTEAGKAKNRRVTIAPG